VRFSEAFPEALLNLQFDYYLKGVVNTRDHRLESLGDFLNGLLYTTCGTHDHI